MSSNQSMIINVNDWNVSANKYLTPKVNTSTQSKSITIISKQSNRTIHLTTPLMMTWGIADFVNDAGESNGKYNISLNFPMSENRTAKSDEFLAKLTEFENRVIDDAVLNSEDWFGQEQGREICKHGFFPSLKYSKNKDTKKIDMTKPPSLRPKVPFYDEVWGVEVYDTRGNLLFPGEDPRLTPMDWVPKLSNVACVIQCSGIWIAAKAWGITWKLVQCVVKPVEVESIKGKCLIELSPEDQVSIEGPPASVAPIIVAKASVPVVQSNDTHVVDSDDEQEEEEKPVVVEPPKPVKKMIKKIVAAPVIVEVISEPVPVAEVVAPISEPEVVVSTTESIVAEVSTPVVKKVMKKIIKKAAA